jgi:hypothetical protein
MLSNQSHKIVQQNCESNASEKCIKVISTQYRNIYNNKERNNGIYMCLYCSRKIKFSGRNNPNAKYNINDYMFNNIDTEEKAYILGFIASDGHISKNRSYFRIHIHKKDIKLLNDIKNYISKDLKIIEKDNMVSLTVSSKQISNDICKLLKIPGGKKSDIVQFPEIDKSLIRHFLRGYFDGDGHIRDRIYPECDIASNSPYIINFLKDNYSANTSTDRAYWSGYNCIEFLKLIYENNIIRLDRKFNRFKKIIEWKRSY